MGGQFFFCLVRSGEGLGVEQAALARHVAGDGHASRVYATVSSTGFDATTGTLVPTGRDLDVAVQGEGYIAVQGLDGREAYTRAGDLRIDASGQLRTGTGLAVLGDGGPVAVPPHYSIAIGGDGTVSIVPLGQGPETRAEIRNIRHGRGIALMVDERWGGTVERKRSVFGDRKGEARRTCRQGNLVAEDPTMARKYGADRIGTGNPPAQASPVIPIRPDLGLIVEAEPTSLAGIGARGIEGHDLEIDIIAELEAVVVGAHVFMARSERHVDAEAVPDMRHAVGQIRCDNRDVIEPQHPNCHAGCAGAFAFFFTVLGVTIPPETISLMPSSTDISRKMHWARGTKMR